jgi:hypothetical protein
MRSCNFSGSLCQRSDEAHLMKVPELDGVFRTIVSVSAGLQLHLAAADVIWPRA